MTVANLGLAIDSSPAARAVVDLDKLVPSAARSEKAFTDLGATATASSARIGTATAQMTAKLMQAANDAENLATRINRSMRVGMLGDSGARGRDIAEYGRQLDTLRAKFNPLYAEITRYKAVQGEIRQAHQFGAISANEMTAALARQRTEALQNIAVLKGRNAIIEGGGNDNSASFRRRNSMYQVADISQGVALGMPLSMVAMQQVPQLAQNYVGEAGGGMKAVKEDLSAVRSGAVAAATSIAGIIGPVGLVTAGLAAVGGAAYIAWRATREESPKVEDALKRQNDLLDELRKRYQLVEDTAKRAFSVSPVADRFRAVDSARELQFLMKDQSKDLLDVNSIWSKTSGLGLTSEFDARTGATSFGVRSEYSAFAKDILQLRETIVAGKPDVETFRKQILERWDLAPNRDELTKTVRKLLDLTDGLNGVSNAFREVEAVRKQIEARQRGPLIGSSDENGRNDYLDQQRLMMRDAQRSFDASTLSMGARSPTELAAAARVNEGLRTVEGESEAARLLRIELAGRQALLKAEHDLAEAQNDRMRSYDAAVSSQRLDLALIGKTAAETARLRFEHEHLAQIEEEAARNRVRVNPAEVAAIQQRAAEIGRLAAQQEALSRIQDQKDQIELGRAELANINLIGPARERAMDAAQAEIDIRKMGIDLYGQEANAIRANIAVLADLREAKERANLNSELGFEIEQMGRSAREATIAQRLRGTGIGMDSPQADLMRRIQGVNDLRDSATGFFSAIKDGVLEGDDIGRNIMRRIADAMMDEADKLLDNVIQNLVRALIPAPAAPGAGTNFTPTVNGFASMLYGGGANDNYAPGAVTRAPLGDAVGLASGLLGQHENRNTGSINSYLQAGGVDLNAAQQAWCAAFVNSSLNQIGVEGTGSNVATSFAKWGTGVAAGDVMRGDVLLQSNGRNFGQTGGHVGLATGNTRMNGGNLQLEMLSGNLGNKVGTDWRNASDLIVRRSEAAGQALDKLGSTSLDATQGLGQFGSSLANAFPAAPTSAGGGGIGSFFSRLFGGGGATTASMSAVSPLAASAISSGSWGLYDTGGFTGHGGRYEVAGKVHRGEVVWNQDDVAGAGGVGAVESMRMRARNRSGGGGSSSMNYAPVSHITIGANAGVTKADVERALDERDRENARQMEKKQANSWRWN